MKVRKTLWMPCSLGFVVLTMLVPALLNAVDVPKEVFTGTLMGIGGTLGGKSIPFTVEISGATSDEDALKYVEILKSKGQDGLLKAIEKNKLGWFKLDSANPQTRGLNLTKWTYDLLTVRIGKGEKGRVIKALFERTPSFYELRQGGRSLDYKFTYMEMYVDDEGKGGGSLIGAAKIRWNKKEEVEIESFGTYPAKIMGLLKRE
jgi:hypothetical protein